MQLISKWPLPWVVQYPQYKQASTKRVKFSARLYLLWLFPSQSILLPCSSISFLCCIWTMPGRVTRPNTGQQGRGHTHLYPYRCGRPPAPTQATPPVTLPVILANAGDAHHSGTLQVTARQVSDLSLDNLMGIICSIVREEQHGTSNPMGSTAASTQATVSTTSSAPTSIHIVVSQSSAITATTASSTSPQVSTLPITVSLTQEPHLGT